MKKEAEETRTWKLKRKRIYPLTGSIQTQEKNQLCRDAVGDHYSCVDRIGKSANAQTKLARFDLITKIRGELRVMKAAGEEDSIDYHETVKMLEEAQQLNELAN
jgi:hypothetical protein